MAHLQFSSPAKLNLFLAIIGRRSDGFHELVSVVVSLDFGDTLTVEARPDGRFTLTCSDPAVPCDGSNLVLKAADAFVAATGWRGGAAFHLEKRIPMGAGLGGGSSNAVAALRALARLSGQTVDETTMLRVAAALGSDCPLFLAGAPVVMRGRGERIGQLPDSAARRLRGRRVLVFKPAFGITTAWAYRRLAEMAGAHPGGAYLPPAAAEERLAAWLEDAVAPAEALLFNTLEGPAFEKFLALPTLLERLRREFGLAPRMTGSGSACFALLPEDLPMAPIAAVIRSAWGNSAFVVEARVA